MFLFRKITKSTINVCLSAAILSPVFAHAAPTDPLLTIMSKGDGMLPTPPVTSSINPEPFKVSIAFSPNLGNNLKIHSASVRARAKTPWGMYTGWRSLDGVLAGKSYRLQGIKLHSDYNGIYTIQFEVSGNIENRDYGGTCSMGKTLPSYLRSIYDGTPWEPRPDWVSGLINGRVVLGCSGDFHRPISFGKANFVTHTSMSIEVINGLDTGPGIPPYLSYGHR